MGLFARTIACASMVMLVACATIADLEHPDDPSLTSDGSTMNGTPPGNSSGSSNTSSAGGPGASDAATGPTPDGGTESDAATPPVCTAPKKPNDQTCAARAECCSNSCNEDGKCHDKCRTNDFCDPFGADCCVDMYCPPKLPFRCKPCKLAGATPEDNLAKSCCSRAVEDGKCK